ncbi:hypothetical protein G9P44_002919 [Scheffersomyces stipitis]|nr:hypothetical protein G9P44_002919 [Scheffersomyces stipitis]
MMSTAPQIYTIQELTDSQKKIVLDTVPTLESAGETLTAQFYQNMFVDFPEVRPFFNQTDQKFLRQPRILAFALLNYAKNIENLEPLTAFVKQIVSKHVGLQVKAEHYPCVGNSLIKTMKELLGPEVANEAFIDAWATAYGNLAQLLIDMEDAEYQKAPWRGFREFTVTKIQDECADVKSIYFKPTNEGDEISLPKRGQYLCFRWSLPGEEQEISREYSISEYPSEKEYRISVRKLEGGKISGYIHNTLKVGDSLKVAPPCGKFVYVPSEKDIVLLVGGIGITPIVSILEKALQSGRNVTMLYSNKTVESRPFGNWLKELKEKYGEKFKLTEFFSNEKNVTAKDVIDAVETRTLDSRDLDQISKDSDVYLLGPREYMKYVKGYLGAKGVEDIKLEYFGPLEV